jgi:hypothetical protein
MTSLFVNLYQFLVCNFKSVPWMEPNHCVVVTLQTLVQFVWASTVCMVVTLAWDATVCSHVTKVTATNVRLHTYTMHTSLCAHWHTHRPTNRQNITILQHLCSPPKPVTFKQCPLEPQTSQMLTQTNFSNSRLYNKCQSLKTYV